MARSGTGIGYTPSQTSTSMPGGFDEEQMALARKRAMLQQLTNAPAVDSGYRGAHWVNPYYAQLGPALAQGFNALAQPEMDKEGADITARRGAAGEQAVQELMDMQAPGAAPAQAPAPQQMTGGAPDPGRTRSPYEPPGVDYAAPSQVDVSTDAPPPAVAEAAINPASVVSTQPQPQPGMVPQALDAAERKQAPGMIPPTAAAEYNKKLAAWALRNASFSPMHAKIAERITEGLPIAGKVAGKSGKWQVSEIYDEKTGLPQKAWVNTDDPTQPPVPIGGTHAVPPDTHQKDVKYLMDTMGLTQRQAVEAVFNMNKPLIVPAGGEVGNFNALKAAGVPPAPAGGMVPAPLNGPTGASPGMVPQPLGAGVPAPLPAKNNAPQAPSNSGLPEGITPGGPYDTRTKAGPGVTLSEGAGSRRGQEKLREDAAALNQRIVSSEEARYEKALKNVEDIIAKHPKGIPGIGTGVSMVPDPLLSKQGQEVRTAIQPLVSTQALMQGGKTLTPNEQEMIRKLTGTGFMNNETQFRQAIGQLRGLFDDVKKRQRAGAHPDVLRLLDSGKVGSTGGKPSLDDIMGGP